MFNKSFLSVLIVTSAFTLVFGQDVEPKKERPTSPQPFAFAFDGNGSYLGIQTQEISKENFAKYGLRDVRGVAVNTVLDNSPAAAAGLKAGDVIVRFDGEEVSGSRKLVRLISEAAPDHQVKITISRGGSEQEILVTVGKRQMPKFENGNFAFSTPRSLGPVGPLGKFEVPGMPQTGEFPRAFPVPGGEGKSFAWRTGDRRRIIGIGVYTLTKQLGEHYGVENGLMVNMVREDSPAAKAGLKAGDIIVEVDGKVVTNDFDLIRIVNGNNEGDVQLTILRGGNRQTIAVTPEISKDGGFFFQTDDGDGTLMPGKVQTMPSAPVPMTAPMPMTAPLTVIRPGRVI